VRGGETTFSQRLEQSLTPYREEYRRLTDEWITSGAFGPTYAALLVETFHYVKHSCSLMCLACARLDHSQGDLQTYLARHIEEEVAHENWVLEDLEVLGYDRAAAATSKPLAETIHLIGSQLYVIHYLDPAGLLGYVYVMESMPPRRQALEELSEAFGIPTEAMKFLIRHGEEDVKHKRDLLHALDHFLRDSRQREAALTSAVMGLADVNRMLARIRSGDVARSGPRAVSAS
jgi:pyrroloquinoline quinone (PQQ) biosynthesis protein C